jgi:hypothetical protein
VVWLHLHPTSYDTKAKVRCTFRIVQISLVLALVLLAVVCRSDAVAAAGSHIPRRRI